MYIPTSGTNLPIYGVSHGALQEMTYGPYYGAQYRHNSSPYSGGYQQPAYSPNYGFVAPTSQGPPIMRLPRHPMRVIQEEVTMAKVMVVISPM